MLKNVQGQVNDNARLHRAEVITAYIHAGKKCSKQRPRVDVVYNDKTQTFQMSRSNISLT